MRYEIPGNDSSRFGARLRSARIRKRLSQSRVAEEAHLVPSYYNMIENGKRMPTVDVLLRIANVLDITLDELFHGEDACDRSLMTLLSSRDPQDLKLARGVLQGLLDTLDTMREEDRS